MIQKAFRRIRQTASIVLATVIVDATDQRESVAFIGQVLAALAI